MSGRTKPLKARRWKKSLNPLEHIRAFATRLTPTERQIKLDPPREALARLRTKTATLADYLELCTAVHNAYAIEDSGVITGQREIIDHAYAALNEIGERAGPVDFDAGTWSPPTCYAIELQALDDLWHAYSRQLHEVTYSEFVAAERKAVSRVRSGKGLVVKAGEVVT